MWQAGSDRLSCEAAKQGGEADRRSKKPVAVGQVT